MIIRLFLAAFFGICLPISGRAVAEEFPELPEDGSAEVTEGHLGLINELAKANADTIEAHCEKIIRGEAATEELFKALPFIRSTVADVHFPDMDRKRVRDSLKKLLFHTKLERTAYFNLQETIRIISEA